jgi:putative nucleotidyltransferase with HDIG domain
MIKKIAIHQLEVGMYVHDFNCSWVDHPFLRNRLLVDSEAALKKIRAAGITELHIDTALGRDVHETPTEAAQPATAGAAASEQPEASSALPGILSTLSPLEEFNLARNIYSNANRLMQDLMKDVRLGKQVRLEQCEPMVDQIVDSMLRMPSALLPLAQIKTHDEYTFQHSVSVAALVVAFGRVLDLPRDVIRDISLGGFLHDVGKAKVPGYLLNKPGKLTDEEFAIMRKHADHTIDLLGSIRDTHEIAFNAAAQHHERFDGSGYPSGLKGEQISLHGQMLAIVDVYDAITSVRVYHKAIPPTEALRRLYEGGGSHFNPVLVQAFIKGIGIYPAGSLVRMESDRLGIVRHVVPDKLLQPVVQLIYDCKHSRFIEPEMIDLSETKDAVKSHESFEKWGIDPSAWASAHV